jgi:hypothetical protein
MKTNLLDKISLSLLVIFLLTLGFTIFDGLTNVLGDQLYKTQLYGILAIVIVMTLVVGFFGVDQSSANKYSSWAVISILSIWSLGVLTLALLIKSHLLRYATIIAWILAVISGLAVLSLYYFWVAILILPFSLFFGYLKLKSDRQKSGIMLAIALDLLLCGIIASFVVSAGLWK